MAQLKQVEIFADGACSGNPGVGGWGAILRFKTIEKEMSGALSSTTNNQMELTAVITPLEALKEPCEATIVTDSQYVANAFNKKWLEKWQQNGWKTSKKEPVKNRELWQRLADLSKKHKLIFKWIKGHAGHAENERCDKLAVAAREKIAKDKT